MHYKIQFSIPSCDAMCKNCLFGVAFPEHLLLGGNCSLLADDSFSLSELLECLLFSL